ncbi:hypothetical protein B0H16DRAFT_1476876 [Mycena metata]|uniref:Uncharacterized protein n=1 Tax=Mycena metata TaxID=1033252 RepID=A0AAD7HAX6_9AGAR|nr:hypothetical protein B0H16DRAFT_1476876 [Mycena metata]
MGVNWESTRRGVPETVFFSSILLSQLRGKHGRVDRTIRLQCRRQHQARTRTATRWPFTSSRSLHGRLFLKRKLLQPKPMADDAHTPQTAREKRVADRARIVDIAARIIDLQALRAEKNLLEAE